MKNPYEPREDIFDYLSTKVPGTFPPDYLHLSKPVYDDKGRHVVVGEEVVIDLHSLIKEAGLNNTPLSKYMFLTLCEKALRSYGV